MACPDWLGHSKVSKAAARIRIISENIVGMRIPLQHGSGQLKKNLVKLPVV